MGGRHRDEASLPSRTADDPQPTLPRIGVQDPSRKRGAQQRLVKEYALEEGCSIATHTEIHPTNKEYYGKGHSSVRSDDRTIRLVHHPTEKHSVEPSEPRKPKDSPENITLSTSNICSAEGLDPKMPPYDDTRAQADVRARDNVDLHARDSAESPENHHQIVVPVRGNDHAIGVRTRSQMEAAAEYADAYYQLLGATTHPNSSPKQLSQLLLALTRKFSRAEAEALALQDADEFEISDETLRRDAAHLRELGSFSALVEYHNNVQKQSGLNLDRVNSILGNDPQIEKIRDIVQNGATIDMAPDFTPIHRTAPYRNLQLRMLPVYKKAVAAMHAANKVLLFHVDDIPAALYAEMHTANEYHWRPEPGKVAGRPLLDCSNAAPGEIPLNSEATKLLGIERYQKVVLPTFHEVMLAWDNYRIDHQLQWEDMWMFKADISGCFNQLHWSQASVRLMGFHLQQHILMIMLTCGFGVGVTPMVWSVIGDALHRYVQALAICIIFTFVDDFFGAGTWAHAMEAQAHVHTAIRGTLGYEGLSVKKNVFAQTAEILGYHVDFPTETVRPKTGAIEKLFFVLFCVTVSEPQPLRYWQCLASLVNMYSQVLKGMRPFVAQIIAMTGKATEYRKQSGTPAALFEIQMWRAAIVIAIVNPHQMAVPLRTFIANSREKRAHPIISDASPWRLCAALYHLESGQLMAWTTYRLPYAKDIDARSQGHREYLGNLLAILLLIKFHQSKPSLRADVHEPLQYFWVNDNQGALAWAEKRKCSSLASQYACMAVSQLHTRADIYMGAPVYKPGIDMGEIDAMSRMKDEETEESPRIRTLCPGLTPDKQIRMEGAVEELFVLCDPTTQRVHDRDHHKAYVLLHNIITRIL